MLLLVRISVDNIHLWKYGDYYFSHNGTVSKYSKYVYFNFNDGIDTCDISDSRQMFSDKQFQKHFNKLIREITTNSNKVIKTVKAVYNYLDSIGFYGIIMANNEEHAVIISNKKFYIYYHNGSIVYANMPLDLGDVIISNIHFKYEKEYCGIMMHNIKDNKVIFSVEYELNPYTYLFRRWHEYEYEV
jgi:hypothetical protein